MKTIRALSLAVVIALPTAAGALAAPVADAAIARRGTHPAGQQLAATCPKTGEQLSGTNKICFYNCVGSTTAITVGATQMCPLSIQG